MKITWEIDKDYQGPQSLSIHVEDMLFEADTVEECMEYIQEEIDEVMIDHLTYKIENLTEVKEILADEIKRYQARLPDDSFEDLYTCASCGGILDNIESILCMDCTL